MPAPPTPAVMLAPGPDELDEATRELDARLVVARAYGAAVARVHGAFAEATIAGVPKDPCASPLAELGARARVFGPAWRDAVQSARAQRDRLVVIAAAPTVVTLLDPADRAALDGRVAEVDRLARAVAEAEVWQARIADPLVGACTATLVVNPGFPERVPDVPRAPVAVIAIGDGRVCTASGEGGRPADGRPMLIVDQRACWAPVGCACDPVRVWPGAVLGPAQAP